MEILFELSCILSQIRYINTCGIDMKQERLVKTLKYLKYLLRDIKSIVEDG